MFEYIPRLKDADNCIPDDDDLIIMFDKRSVILDFSSGRGMFPRWAVLKNKYPESISCLAVGFLDGRRCLSADKINISELPAGLQEFPVRQFLFEYPEDWQTVLCRAKNLLTWRTMHRFCGGCRSELVASVKDSGLICPECGKVYYPQLSPAVIVAITRNEGRELLLAHNSSFSGNMYSLIAGFVEAGESVESAVHREIKEECGIQVKNLRYITSQMWPFPNSLMLAFQAEYASGNAEADGNELSDLGWFTKDEHPELPAHGSVARTVIDLVFGINQ